MKKHLKFTLKTYDSTHNSKLCLYLQSFFATWAIMRIGNLHSMNIIAFLFFLLCTICFSAMEKDFSLHTYGNEKIEKIQWEIVDETTTDLFKGL